jgi:peptidoglycan hydrolase-like protein with peptidoglycan-binding domain
MSQAEDMSAIQRYMAAQTPKNEDSRALKAEFIKWFDNLSFWDRTLTSSTYVDAKKRRDAFMMANATTPAEIAAVRAVQKKAPIITKTESGTVQVNQETLPPSIKRGAKNDPEAVKKWQRLLGIEDDGRFGPDTEKKSKAWQASHGLTADGKIGPKTWTVALGLKGTPTPAKPSGSSTSAKPSSGTDASASTSAKPASKLAQVKEKFRDETAGVPLWGKIVGTVLILFGVGAGVKAVQEAKEVHKSRRKVA